MLVVVGSPSGPLIVVPSFWILTRKEEIRSLYCIVFLIFLDAAALTTCKRGPCSPSELGWGVSPSLATQVHGKHAKRAMASLVVIA